LCPLLSGILPASDQEDEMGLLDKLLGREKKSHEHGHDREHGHEHTPEYNDLQTKEPPPAATSPPPAPPTTGTETTES
jgi:hypothetical protein